MGGVVNYFAFPKTPSSYDESLPYLSFITVDKCYKIPIVHYHRDDNLKTIIYAHANSEDIGKFDVEILSDLFGCNILLFDYANYGLHSCKISNEENCYVDIMYTYSYLIKKGVKNENIVLLGRSIGTPVVGWLNFQLSKKNIYLKTILVSPFKSLLKVGISLPYMPYDMFRLDQMAPEIFGPILIIHGCRDSVCPCGESRELSKLFPNLYDFCAIHGVGHHKIFLCNHYYDIIREFIEYTE